MKKIPKLRFKEFTDEWEEKKFDEVFSFLQNNTFSRECLTNEIQEVQNIHYGDILTKYNNILKITNDIPYIKKEYNLSKFNEESFLKNGDIIIADTAEDFTVGKAIEINNFEKKKILSGLHTFACRTNFNFAFGYLGQYMNSTQYHSQLYSLVTGIKVSSISKQSIKDTKLSFPKNEKEQEKIADFLSSIDKKISITEEKLNLFNEYKKGIMQKIFSQELKFKDKDENDYPEWEEKNLGEIGEIITGKTPSTKDEKNWNGSIQFVTPTDINDNKYQKSTQRKVSENIKMKILPIGTIMFTCIASIGKMAISTKQCITNQQINSIIVNSNICNEYVYYVLLNLVPKIQASQSTTTLPIINKTEFSKFIIDIPCLEEQKKIADFLSAIDTKIEKISDELENLKEFKKGLLQQMFV